MNWSDRDIRDFIDSLAFIADLVEPTQVTDPLLRDAADQSVLVTFLASNANYFVTGDKDLLSFADFYPIKTPADFWQLHGN